MKKTKSIFVIFLIGIFAIVGIEMVAAQFSNVETDGSGGTTSGGGAGGGNGAQVPTNIRGVRISIVDKEYRLHTNSVLEYVVDKDSALSRLDGANRASIQAPRNHSYNQNGVDFSGKVDGTGIYDMSVFDTIFNSNYPGLNINGKTMLAKFNMEDTIQKLSKDNASVSDELYYEYVKAIFEDIFATSGLDFSDDNYINRDGDEPYYDAFIIVEPMLLVKSEGEYYWGTNYELSSLARDTDAKPGVANSTWGFFNMRVAITREQPCTLYLTGSLYDQTIFASINDQKLSGLFSGTSYFGGRLTIRSDAKTNCSGPANNYNYFFDQTKFETEGSNGVGIGIIWPSSFIEIEQDGCDFIKDNINLPSNWETVMEQQFNAGGRTGVINYVNNTWSAFLSEKGVPYTSSSGEVKFAPADWFVDNCTCYGMYDYYEKTDSDSYYNEMLKADWVINLKNTLGSSNWHVPLDLYEIKPLEISNNFLDKYNTYKKETPSEYLNRTDVDWETIDYADYEGMVCGSQPDNWCDEVFTFFDENDNFGYPDYATYSETTTDKNKLNSTQLQNMLNAYNVTNYPAMNFWWKTTGETTTNNTTGITEYNFAEKCPPSGKQPFSCTSVEDYFEGKGIDLTKLPAEKIYDYEDIFKEYPYYEMTPEEYVTLCPRDNVEEVAFNCTPQFGLGTCIDRDTISYTDTFGSGSEEEYWENCIFNDYGSYDVNVHKEADKSSSLTYYEKSLGNDYCEVYCVEETSFDIVSREIFVDAGSYFTLPDSFAKGSRTCKTKEVLYDKFEADLLAANKAVVDAYAAYMLVEEQKDVDYDKEDCEYRSGTIPCASDPDKRCPNYKDGSKWVPDDRRVSYSVSNSTIGYSESLSASMRSSSCSRSPSKPTYNSSDEYRDYLDALEYVESLISKMENCYNWDVKEIYNVNPILSISYENSGVYNYDEELIGDTDYEIEDNSVCVSENEYYIDTCSGKTCSGEMQKMENCTIVDMTRSADTTFEIEDGVFQYIEKETNLSFHAFDSSKLNSVNNYIDVKISNLPVAYNTKAGVYGTNSGNGKYDYSYKNIGHLEGGSTAVDTLLKEAQKEGYITGDTVGEWICEYNVSSNFIIEDDNGGDNDGDNDGGYGGIRIIYRPIDLDNPFPDITSIGRVPGDNWQGSAGIGWAIGHDGISSLTSSKVEEYILDNRDVISEELYGLDPMYTFILTPEKINEIREYNKNNDYGAYVGNTSSNISNCEDGVCGYTCTEGTGGACISDYLSYLIEITGAINEPGTCVESQFRNSNEEAAFYGCRFDTSKPYTYEYGVVK